MRDSAMSSNMNHKRKKECVRACLGGGNWRRVRGGSRSRSRHRRGGGSWVRSRHRHWVRSRHRHWVRSRHRHWGRGRHWFGGCRWRWCGRGGGSNGGGGGGSLGCWRGSGRSGVGACGGSVYANNAHLTEGGIALGQAVVVSSPGVAITAGAEGEDLAKLLARAVAFDAVPSELGAPHADGGTATSFAVRRFVAFPGSETMGSAVAWVDERWGGRGRRLRWR